VHFVHRVQAARMRGTFVRQVEDPSSGCQRRGAALRWRCGQEKSVLARPPARFPPLSASQPATMGCSGSKALSTVGDMGQMVGLGAKGDPNSR